MKNYTKQGAMDIEIITTDTINIALIKANSTIIHETQDALDLMADCGYRGCRNIILNEEHLNPEFFNLKSKIAGEILQKFSNYNVRLAIIGDFSKYSSKSLHDFIFESNKYRRINFVSTLEEAKKSLTI